MNTDHQEDHVTAAAIARRAGVGRAAVSNWRRRYAQFPEPVGGSPSSPVFSWAAVLEWLVATGKAGQLVTAGRTDTGTQFIGSGSHAGYVPQERAVADLEPRQLLARVMVALLPYLDDPGADEADTDEPEVGGSPVVLDPACGTGQFLLAVADRFGDGVTLAGQEADETAAVLAATELRSHPAGVPYDIQTGDSLLVDHLDRYLGIAAAVVCALPPDVRAWPVAELAGDPRWRFGLPDAADAELAWVQHCYAHLRPRGAAVVAVSARTCVRPSGRSIRAALVRSGVLRDVIALPPGLGADLHLWVLQRPYSASERAAVRMIDLSGLADPADVPHGFADWDGLFRAADPAVVRAVPRLELLDGDTGLLPSQHVALRRDAGPGDLAVLTARLQSLYTGISRAFPPPVDAGGRPDRPLVTLAELERSGALTVRSRDTTPHRNDVLLRTLGRPPVVARCIEDDSGGIPRVVDVDGVAQVVEIDPTRLDPHFVAMFLRVDVAALPAANTHGAPSRDDLRRCRLPRIPFAEQRRFGDSFRHLLDLQDAVSALAAVSVTLIDQTIHGLTTGALTPRVPPARGTIVTDAEESETQ